MGMFCSRPLTESFWKQPDRRSANTPGATTSKLCLESHNRNSGYSFIELLVVMVVIMVLSAIAVPSGLSFIANIRLRGAASEFAGLVQQARLTAVRKNGTYTVLFNVAT